MLDPSFKARWVAALRSGDYEQGMNALCRVNDAGATYCCLGVAFEVANGEDAWIASDDAAFGDELFGDYTDESLWAPPGLSWEVANILAVMNDGGKTFDEIADYIEANL